MASWDYLIFSLAVSHPQLEISVGICSLAQPPGGLDEQHWEARKLGNGPAS